MLDDWSKTYDRSAGSHTVSSGGAAKVLAMRVAKEPSAAAVQHADAGLSSEPAKQYGGPCLACRADRLREEEGDVPAARADIKHPLSLHGPAPFHRHLLPDPVLPQAQHIVHLHHTARSCTIRDPVMLGCAICWQFNSASKALTRL